MTEDQPKGAISPEAPRNGIFIQLAIVGFFLAAASSGSLLLSYAGGRLQNYEGSPSDEAILYCFVYGLAVSQVVNLFMPAGSLRALLSLRFLVVVAESLVFAVPGWLLVAWWGGHEVEHLRGRIPGLCEIEWLQISLVLISSSLTLLTWHGLYHRKHGSLFRDLRAVLIALKLTGAPGKPEVEARPLRAEDEGAAKE